MRGPIVALLLLAAVAAPSPAHADEAADKRKAKAHYKLGLEYQKEGQYLQAADEYKAAYALTPRPELLYNIARAYQLGGDRKQAAAYYQKFLDEVPEGEAADEARQFLAQMAREADEEERKRQEEARRKQEEEDAARKQREADEAEEQRKREEAAKAEPHQVPDTGSSVAPPEAEVETPAAPRSRFHRLRLGLLAGAGIAVLSEAPPTITPDGEGNIPGGAVQLTADVQFWVTPSFLVRLDVGLERREVNFEECQPSPCVPFAQLHTLGLAFALLPGVVLYPDGRVSLMLYAGLSGSILDGEWETEQGGMGGAPPPIEPIDATTGVDAVGGVALRIRAGGSHLLLDVRGMQGLSKVIDDAQIKSISVLLGFTWGL